MDVTTGRLRRFHVKTRRGCTQCKRKKTKCNEQRPSCEKCSKQGLVCSFANGESSIIIIPASSHFQPNGPRDPTLPTLSDSPCDTSTTSPFRTSKATPSIFTQNAIGSPGDTSFADGIIPEARKISSDEIVDLRLMHHYSLSTSQKLAATSESLTVWHDLVPPLAFEHDFLLHGMLAVTALEQALSDDSTMKRNSTIALRHYTVGLAIFRVHLTAITPHNIAALFVFSVFAVAHVFGFPLTLQRDLSSPLSTIYEIFALVRGCAVIVRSGLKWLEDSPYKHLLLPRARNPFQALPLDVEEALTVINIQNFKQYGTEPALRDAFTETIGILRHTMLLALDGSLKGQMSAAVPFVIQMPEIVVAKVREEESMALVLVAHYAVILHWSRHVVWVKGWGRLLVDTIQQRLGEDWMPCIAWAMVEVRREDARRVDGF